MASDTPFTEARGKFESSRAALTSQEREVGVLTFVQYLLPETFLQMRRSKDYIGIQAYFATAPYLINRIYDPHSSTTLIPFSRHFLGTAPTNKAICTEPPIKECGIDIMSSLDDGIRTSNLCASC